MSRFNMNANRNKENNNNHNKNNRNNVNNMDEDSDNNNDDGQDTLDQMALFNFNDDIDDDSKKQNEKIERDAEYIYNSYEEYVTKKVNDPNTRMGKRTKKIEGDFSNDEWFRNPKDKSGRSHKDDPNHDPSQIFIPQKAYKQMKPLRAQWWKLKSDHYDGILCFKKGNFYQLYYEDAWTAHRIFGITAYPDDTNAGKTGFPEQSFDKFAETFVKYGYKVLIICTYFFVYILYLNYEMIVKSKVYRVEQTETQEQQKARKGKLTKREVCEVLTPGTLVPNEFLSNQANYILCIVEETENKNTSSIDVGVCFGDFSTGHFFIGNFIDDRNRSRLRTLIFQIDPAEIAFERDNLSKETMSLLKADAKKSVLTKIKEEDVYDQEKTKSVIQKEKYWNDFDEIPDILKKAWKHKLTMSAIGGILRIMQHTMHDHEILPHSEWHIYDPTSDKCNSYLTLDGSTLANLEILSNDIGGKRGTLFQFIDKCSTKFGSRMLKDWLKYPLNQLKLIQERLDAVEYLINDCDYWDTIDIKTKLKKLPDLERLLHNLAVLGTKNRMMDKAVMHEQTWDKRKVKKLIDTMDAMENLAIYFDQIENHRDEIKSKLVKDITTVLNKDDDDNDDNKSKMEVDEDEEKKVNDRHIPEFGHLLEEFTKSFDRDYALETGIIQPTPGYNSDYDIVKQEIRENGQELEDILKGIRKKFGKNIKWNQPKRKRITETYLIEVPKSLKIKPPPSWDLKASIAKFDRYHTPQIEKLLKVREALFDRKDLLERDCARETFARFAKNGKIWKKIVNNLSILDCLLSLAQVSQYSDFEMTRPQFIKPSKQQQPFLEIRNCRHPCIDEESLNLMGTRDGAAQFIPNDTILGCKENKSNFVIVTGPNMGGKSTLLRQTCIAVILAHIGCYVPCQQMKLTPVDRIFTRVGANDRILAGQSTFMVELEETSNILKHATKNSLVILDELGRGTSTFDGTAIAFAVAKTLINDIECRTLFSTHYHGLTDAFIGNDKVGMYHMSYKQKGNDIIFLYKFTKGICKQSHGINCAKLAGMPQDLLDKAEQESKKLHDSMHNVKQHGTKEMQKVDLDKLVKSFKGLVHEIAHDQDKLWQNIQNEIKQ